MADLSSNNGDESPQRAKKGGGAKRKSRHSRNLLTPTGYSSGAEMSQSAFPVPTPDRLGIGTYFCRFFHDYVFTFFYVNLFWPFLYVGPLTDLLEEDSELPSRETSGKKRPDWSFLPRPKTPGTTSSSSESYGVSTFLRLFDIYSTPFLKCTY